MSEERQHALLSASSSHRWRNCPPSAVLAEQYPKRSSVYAAEGTFCHSLAEFKLRHGYLHEPLERPQSEQFDGDEAEELTDIYRDFVVETAEELASSGIRPLFLVEARLDFSDTVPSGFGTGDAVLIGKDPGTKLTVLHVIDLKAGKGVLVSSDHNPQLMLYALGAIQTYGYLYDIDLVRMTIVQPRRDNISTFECTMDELMAFKEEIRPIAELAYRGGGELKAGEWCRFCPVRPQCRACAEEALSLARGEFLDLDAGQAALPEAEVSDTEAPYERDDSAVTFKSPGVLPLSELVSILPTLNRISAWIEAVFAFVSAEAIQHGVPIEGYKVVEGRSNRVFTDADAVVKVAADAGYDLYKREVMSPAESEKKIGKKKFAALLGEYVTKPRGKLSLVPESDKRPAVDVGSGIEDDGNALDDFEALD